MYIVTKMFTDLQDDGFRYEAGDEYPREGYEPSKERIKELAGENNKRGVSLIKQVKAPKKSGGKKASK